MLATLPRPKGKSEGVVLEEFLVPSLAKRRRSEMEAFLVALRSDFLRQHICSPDGSVQFALLVQLAIRDYGVQQSDLARACEYDVATVGRWANGKSIPKHPVRAHVIDRIAMLIEHDLKTRL